MRRRLNVNEIARRLDRVVADVKQGQGEQPPGPDADGGVHLQWCVERLGLGRMLQALEDGTALPSYEEIARMPILPCYRTVARV